MLRWLLVLLLVSTAHADSTGPLILGRETKLLGWRLVADLPEEMTEEGNAFSMVHKLVHFKLVVADSFGVGEFVDIKVHAAFNHRELADAKVEKLQLASLTGYGLQPKAVANRAGRSLVYAAYVIVPKGTVKVFEFYVDPGADNTYAWVSLAKKIVQTVRSGRNADRLDAGGRQICYRECAMSLDAPDGWVITHEAGELRWGLREVVTLGKQPATCEIAYHTKAGPTLDLTTATTPATRLWDGTEWKVVSSKDRHEASAHTNRAPNVPLDLHCAAPNATALDRILGIMSTLRPTAF